MFRNTCFTHRRTTIALATALVASLTALPAGCAADPATITPAPPTADPLAGPTADPGAEPLAVEIASHEVAVGLERVAFHLKDAAGAALREGTVNVEFYRTMPSGQSSRTASGPPAVYFGRGLPDGGAWVIYSNFDSSGPWDMRVSATRDDGSAWRGAAIVQLDVIGRSVTPRTGAAPPFGATPTLAAGGDATALTSDPSPDPDLYALSIEQARTSGKPTIIVFGSPAHCPSDLCRAVLDEVKAVKLKYHDQVNVIHVETHDLQDPQNLTPAAAAWGVGSGPWVFILDTDGLVATRIEGSTDRTELELWAQRLLGG
jgi:hypothetical protein